MNTNRTDLSIVIPVYNDQEVLDELYKRLKNAVKEITEHYEIVFIDDGSTDESFLTLKYLQLSDSRVKILKLARNFGQQNSIAAGLTYASGDYIVLMDSDLQDKPEDIILLINKMEENDTDMAIAKWITKKDSFLKKSASNLFFHFSRYTTGIKYEKGLGVFRVIRKNVLDQIINIPETTGTILSLMYWSGIDYSVVELERDKRFAGTSGYNLMNMLQLTADRIFSYSLFPIRLATRMGVLLAFLAFGYALFLIAKYFLLENIAPGWTSTIVVIVLLFGINFLFLGIIGEYLGRIYIESKGRPKYVISRIMDNSKDEKSSK